MALGFKGCDGGFLSLLLALLFSLQQRPTLGRIFHLKSEQRSRQAKVAWQVGLPSPSTQLPG